MKVSQGMKMAIAAVLIFLGVLYLGYRMREGDPEETLTVNERVDQIYRSFDQAIEEIRQDKERVTEHVTVIREAVRIEVEELDPDGLAEFALNEINVYLGGQNK
jgi:hypothetical protein